MNDDTLTLYYYNDGLTGAERREVESALRSDPALAVRYRELCEQLDGLKEFDSLPAPSHLVARWHDVIDKAGEREAVAVVKPSSSFHFGSFFWGTAVTAALALGIAIGIYMSGSSVDGSVPANTYTDIIETPEARAPTAFSRGLLVHFQESRDQLTGLDAGANGARSQLIMNIIQQNRLFERMASQNESPDLARVLRAFEPILTRLAADDISPEDAEKLQAQLAFELNIVLTKLARQVSDKTDSIDI